MISLNQVRRDQSFIRGESIDSFSDLHSSFSRVTSSSLNDIDNIPFKITFKIVVLFSAATVGGLLFGYDTGVISGVLLSLEPSDIAVPVLTNFDKELITSITSIGSFIGSILGFPLADKYGRKTTLAVCSVGFIISAVWLALSMSLTILILGRFLVGIAVGIAAQCVPIYLSEISPTRIRGTILALNSIAITSGQLIAYIVSYLISDFSQSWRFLFGFSAIPAILFILLLDFIPESPRWLIGEGKITEAHKSLLTIYSTSSNYLILIKLRKIIIDIINYQEEIQSVQEYTPLLQSNRSDATDNAENSGNNDLLEDDTSNLVDSSPEDLYDTSLSTIKDRLTMNKQNQINGKINLTPGSKRALIVGCILMFFQQVSGFNVFMYYAGIIFAKLGVKNPLLPIISIALTNFIFTIVAMQLVDRIGRRTMLLFTIPIMTLGLIFCSANFESDNTRLILLSTVAFVAAYSSAMGTIPWNSVEFLPLNVRSYGAACISCTNWLTNSLVSMSSLSLMNKIGNKNTFLIFSSFTVLNWVFVFYCYPEVKGLTLEEIYEIFQNGIDVNYVHRKYNL
ncbi:hypothetical protein Kpol_543p5 [Vanderwaltozyma polyspora DSM 70294]|uniref:Major facilitator superfamily (MFS) profile domain-containing protein n=1 Tax=Vanderwaltozyma polyspora (strain ATCC 22028 / DSM 70294 / BCRC 21397 / CBS 2163 / NBRC 10782 / NRRL Y-8283 / UCD 57-17) TaxID=436907 RepID=A7THL0_VANPO|nr:uncharacterized protein Kpol_543p5 [Vanderwaltozyma polyspora DSM 70294]EDO18176.1 hypothetical protein Kpol_543p5 [Vanderwaltozyma polyspora DSM 70294]